MAARIDDERCRVEQSFDLIESKEAFRTAPDQACGGLLQYPASALDFRRKSGDTGLLSGAFGASECRTCRRRLQTSDSHACDEQVVHRLLCLRQRRWLESGQQLPGAVEAARQQVPPNLQVPCLSGIDRVTVTLERHAGGIQCFSWPPEVSGRERHFRFRDDASRLRYGFAGTEGTRRPSQQRFRTHEIAELRHCDAA
jgi:hypothetical protein